jgi:hypothetical protein
MDTKDIIVFAAVFLFLVFRLYQKYGKKNKTSDSSQQKKNLFGKKGGLSSQSDDYEPYSNK